MYMDTTDCGCFRFDCDGVPTSVSTRQYEPLERWQKFAVQTGKKEDQKSINSCEETVGSWDHFVWDVKRPCDGGTGDNAGSLSPKNGFHGRSSNSCCSGCRRGPEKDTNDRWGWFKRWSSSCF